MIKSYFKVTLRSLLKNKSTFTINMVGLSTGLAGIIMIFLWVNDEISIDKFHQNDEQLYQVMEVSEANDAINTTIQTQGLLAETMAKDLPEIEAATTFFSVTNEGYEFNLKTTDEKIIKAGAVFADEAFFKIFSYNLIEGNSSQVLTEKESVVISKSLSEKLYGEGTNAVGKPFECSFFGNDITATVTGVIADVPANSSQQFDFVLTKATLFEVVPNFKEWGNEGTNTFLQLKVGTNITAFNKKIKNFVHAYSNDTRFTLFVRSYSDAYLYDTYENGVQAGGRIDYVKLFSVIGLFILSIACINFVNLSTATASKREKEIGIKKAVGSSRGSLIAQFLIESVMTVLVSLVIAVLLVVLLLPQFNEITEKSISLNFDPITIALLFFGAVLTGVISGYYPAFYLSGITTIEILKGKVKTSFSELVARKGLVVFQFTISLFLIVSVLAVYNQISFIQNMNLGYERDNVVYLDMGEKPEVFIAEAKEFPGVMNASSINGAIAQSGDNANTSGLNWEGRDPKKPIVYSVKTVDYDLIETLGIEMAEGRSFSREFGAEGEKLIFNETAIKTMGIKNPIGKKINMWGEEKTIVGVTKDFFANSVHEEIPPIVMRFDPSRTSEFVVKIAAGKEKQTIKQLSELYAEFNPGFPFNYAFMDEKYNQLYASEQRVATLSKYFAGLAILISCLGLFGLAMFNAKQRAKEIGIRKVLGASVGKVVIMLSKDFVKLAVIAVFIAFPISWYALTQWLDNYAYKADLSIMTFVLSFAGIVIITLLTVSYQAIKAALANPVESLKSE